jgi:hypothetical protein
MAILASALACRTSPAGTACGVNAAAAGSEIAASAPFTALRTSRIGIEVKPSRTLRASRPCTAAEARADPWSRSALLIRSASTPPKSSRATFASDRTPTTRPRSAVEPVRSSTAKASATGAMELAKYAGIRPPARRRNPR